MRSLRQAQRIQRQRLKAWKAGHAKAVHRYLKREYPDSYASLKLALPALRPLRWREALVEADTQPQAPRVYYVGRPGPDGETVWEKATIH